MPTRPQIDHGSTIRLIVGLTLIVVALGTALVSFVQLITTLERGGYGTTAMRAALVALGAAGACLAAGVATVIWDLSKRFEGR
jgi:hypothetical protein